MSIRPRKVAAVSIAAALATTLAACGSTNTSSSVSQPTLTEDELSGKTISFIPGVNDPFYISMQCGIESSTAKYGINVDTQIPQQFEAAEQTPIVNAAAATKPAAMLIAPTDTKALVPPLQRAASEGVPIGLVDTTLEDSELPFTSVSTDNQAAGAQAAEALAELIGESGKVMVIAFKAGASTSDARQQGFEEKIKDYPNITNVGAQINDNDPAKAASIVSATLAAHPDLKGIFATNLFAAQGAATGLRNAGKLGQVNIVGFDAGGTQVEQLQRGDVQALIAQKPAEIGQKAVEQVVTYLTGGTPEAHVAVDTVVLTQDNLEQMQDVVYKESC